MDTSSEAAAAGTEGGMSELRRVFGIFWEPGAVFQDLAARPRWWVPMLLVIASAVVYTYAFSQIVGWRTFLEGEFARNERLQQLSAEMQRQIIQQQLGIVEVMAYVGAVAGSVIVLAAVAALLLMVFKIAGGADLTFRQSLAVTCYSWLPFALYYALALVVMAFGRPEDFDLKNPLPFNPGWFLDPASSSPWAVTLASSLDLFSLWVIALLALGYSTAARKVKFGKAFAVVLSVWAVYVLVKTGWTALFG